MTNRKGNDFTYYHLTTFSDAKLKHVDNVFNAPRLKLDKLGRDLLFCSTILSFVFATKIEYITETFEEFSQYKLIPIRWTHKGKSEKLSS